MLVVLCVVALLARSRLFYIFYFILLFKLILFIVALVLTHCNILLPGK